MDLRAMSVAGPTVRSGIRVGLLTEDGAVDWAPLRAPGTVEVKKGRVTFAAWHAVWHSPVAAVGLLVDSGIRAVVSPPAVNSARGGSFVLDGVLQSAIVAPHWRYGDQDGAFAVFVNQRARSPLSLRALPGKSLRGAAVHRVSGPSLEPSAALVSSQHGVEVVRAVAAMPGWAASWTPISNGRKTAGATEPLAVHRFGVVQVVRVPPGRGTLTWRYVAPGLLAGEIVSAVALVFVGGLALALAVAWRARRLLGS